MADLATVDLPGVEILSTGGPVHGAGSPPDGDHWTTEDLQGMAAAAAALGDEIRAPAKLGHSDHQAFAKTGLTDGEMPAAGWLDNIRLNDDGSKLLADIRRVPATLAELIKAGAYRTRSVELSRVTSQRTGKTYDWAVTGLAWLGGKMPAVQTLGDWAKLYDSDDSAPQFVQIEESKVNVDALCDALAGFGGRLLNEQQAVLDAHVESRSMSDDATITTDDLAPLAEALGVEGDVTIDALVEASTARANELAAAKAAADEADTRRNEASDLTKTVRKLEADLKVEQTKRYEMERDTAIEAAVRDGRIDPADESKWAKRYDANPELTAEIMGDLTPDPSLVRELGRDDDGDGGEINEDDFARDFERRFGQADPLKARQ